MKSRKMKPEHETMNIAAIGALFDLSARARRRRTARHLESLSPSQRADIGLPAPVERELYDPQVAERRIYLESLR